MGLYFFLLFIPKSSEYCLNGMNIFWLMSPSLWANPANLYPPQFFLSYFYNLNIFLSSPINAADICSIDGTPILMPQCAIISSPFPSSRPGYQLDPLFHISAGLKTALYHRCAGLWFLSAFPG
jgi:hypothetical protein